MRESLLNPRRRRAIPARDDRAKEQAMNGQRVRPLGWLVLLLAAGLLAPAGVLAQGATPPTGDTIASVSREEYARRLREHYGFEEPRNRGGRVAFAQTEDVRTLNGL